jgi:hypothetical protein
VAEFLNIVVPLTIGWWQPYYDKAVEFQAKKQGR